jgi:HK97 family phage portal protein
MPHFQVNPRFQDDGTEFVTDYIYRNGRKNIILAKENVLHIRNGLSMDNVRKGTCPLLSVLREMCSDNEAATAAAAIMRNLGIPGLAFTPAPAEEAINMTMEQQEMLRIMAREKFTGDRRGEMFVAPIPGKLETIGFEPEKLAFDKVRRVPEERICAVLGIPAIVAGMGAGLERSTFANFKEAREAAYESCLVPMYRVMAEQLSFSLLPRFDEDPTDLRFYFDVSEVKALQEDQNEFHDRVREDWVAGLVKRTEARTELGLKASAEDDIYYQDLAKATEPDADNKKEGKNGD